MLQEVKYREFANGSVHCLKTDDGFLIECTDTFLPFYTKDAANQKTNSLTSEDLGSRRERWMIGVSTMSGCPVRCKFCATGRMKKFRNLTADEIVEQVMYVLSMNKNTDPKKSREFKINYTRMGEPFLNLDAVREAIHQIDILVPNAHHYISTIGIKNADYSWVKGNVTLQISLHSLDDEKRNDLIPFKNKVSIQDLGQIRTQSNLKTTLNMTLVDENDFDIVQLKKNFASDKFFVKLSPINVNEVSRKNNLGNGAIKANNLV